MQVVVTDGCSEADRLASVLDRLREPLPEAEEVPRDTLVREAEDRRIAVRLGDRRLEELDSRADVVVVRLSRARNDSPQRWLGRKRRRQPPQ